MKKIVVNILVMVALGLPVMAGDTTFSWSGPQNSGNLTYGQLIVTNSTIIGGVQTNVTISGGLLSPATLNVTGNSTQKTVNAQNVTVATNLTVTGLASVGTANVSGVATVATLTVTASGTVATNLTVTGLASANTLNVSGIATQMTSTVIGSQTVGTNQTVTGLSSVGNLNVTGNSTQVVVTVKDSITVSTNMTAGAVVINGATKSYGVDMNDMTTPSVGEIRFSNGAYLIVNATNLLMVSSNAATTNIFVQAAP